MPFIEKTNRILSTNENAVQLDSDVSFKAGLRHELEQVGWQYNSRATFKANFPFRSKYLVLDSTIWMDDKDIYRIRVQVKGGSPFAYKLMKWVL